MGTFTLSAEDDPVRIVPPGADEPHKLTVREDGAGVRVGHSRGSVRSTGDRVRPGDRARLSRFKGEPVFAVRDPDSINSGPATFDVAEATLDVSFFPRTTVRGSNGTVATTTDGTVETDNYGSGGAFDFDGANYPYTVDPAPTIQELVITTAGDIVARITTVDGVTFDLPLVGGLGAFDKWATESVEFRDPRGTTARVAGGWAGE